MATHNITKTNFNSEIANSDIPVITDFWASWCGPCRMMGPVFDDLSNDYEGKLKFTKISTETEAELAHQFEISSIPCLVITKDGKEVERITGFMPKPLLKQKIDSILEGIA